MSVLYDFNHFTWFFLSATKGCSADGRIDGAIIASFRGIVDVPHNYPMDLQFFAQEKTEKATPKKREEVRKKGQVAKSAEVTTAFILLFVFILLYFVGMDEHYTSFALSKKFTWSIYNGSLPVHNIQTLFTQVITGSASIGPPVMAIALAAGVSGNYIQIGFLFSTDPLKVKLDESILLKGFKRIFSMRAIVEFLKSMLKILLLAPLLLSSYGCAEMNLSSFLRKDVDQCA